MKKSKSILILSLVLCIFTLSSCSSFGSSDREIDAWVCAQNVVEQKLKSPSTADFCSYTSANIVNISGNDYKVEGYVDAENSFGAKIRTYFTVRLTLTEHGYTDGSVQFY